MPAIRQNNLKGHSSEGKRELPKLAFGIREFCDSLGISRSFFYELVKSGRGPRIMRLGKRRLISLKAAEAFCQRMETSRDPGQEAA